MRPLVNGWSSPNCTAPWRVMVWAAAGQERLAASAAKAKPARNLLRFIPASLGWAGPRRRKAVREMDDLPGGGMGQQGFPPEVGSRVSDGGVSQNLMWP